MTVVEESEAALLMEAVRIAMELADVALTAGEEVAAIHFAHGADLLMARARLLEPVG